MGETSEVEETMSVPVSIIKKIGLGLHCRKNHPLQTIKEIIYGAFPGFNMFDDFSPIVRIEDNFDLLMVPIEHPSRSIRDTFYINGRKCLRTHTSAHQNELIKKGERRFLVTGDVYRKDDIDRFHYPIFHQTEGVCLAHWDEKTATDALKEALSGLINRLFGPTTEFRFVDCYFPFTDPSWEVEIYWDDQWIEVLGCGLIHKGILKNCGVEDQTGWAFGLGMERLAMILFGIPDIRLFWSQDQRFKDQFTGSVIKFQPFSSQPPCEKDIAFWTGPKFFHTEFCQLVREIAGELVEDVRVIDKFKKDDKESICYRITYRAMDRTLTNEEINSIQEELRVVVKEQLDVTLR